MPLLPWDDRRAPYCPATSTITVAPWRDVSEMGVCQPHVQGNPQKGRPLDGKGTVGLQVPACGGLGDARAMEQQSIHT